MADFFFQNFELPVTYISGNQNHWADILSCSFDYQGQLKLSHSERSSVLKTYISALLKFSDKSDANDGQGLQLGTLISDILKATP